MPQKLFLIDGHSYCYQAFYAISGRGLTAPDGKSVNAVYVFANMLRRILKELKPQYLAAAFDEKGPTFRHQMYKEYKANRKPPPEELTSQILMVKQLLDAYGIPVYSAPGYEADDVIGTLTRQATQRSLEVCLLMTDKDARQLLGPNVSLMNGRSGEALTEEKFRETTGLRPEQVVDVMALSGDSSDNIPGVRGIGPKTATELIREWGSLKHLLSNLDKVKQARLKRTLSQNADQALLSRRLVTIDMNAPVQLALEACKLEPQRQKISKTFQKLGFKSLLEEVGPPKPTREERDYRLVDTAEKFDRFVAELKEHRRFAFDLETTSTHPVRAQIVGMAFSWAPRQGAYLPLRTPKGQAHLETQSALSALEPILCGEDYQKVGQNLKYDSICMLNAGYELKGIAFDTMLAAYCLDPTRRRYNLDYLASDLLSHHTIPISALIGKGRNQIRMDQVPVNEICDYACEDADIALRLADHLEPKLREAGCHELYMQADLPLVEVLAHMEHHGIGFDPGALEEMAGEINSRLEVLERDIHKEAGEQFNVASPKQLSAILFEKLHLPVIKKTRTGASTDADVLAELAIEHRLPYLVLEHRKLSKLLSTYLKALPKAVLPQTGRIHASFNQTATATGRLSSSDPNLQNVPVRTELGSRIRSAFVPTSAQGLILAADYSQIELRIVAHLSEDKALLDAFNNGEDIHASVAAQIAAVPIEQVTADQRRMAKAVNFGIIYGQTPYGLSRSLSIPMDEAQSFIEAYFERYSGVRAFIDRTLEKARKDEYVTTSRGRKRKLPDINSADPKSRNFAERAAVNTVVQGTAADMIKKAMVDIHRALRHRKMRTRMVLQIHDELVFDVPADELEQTKAMVPSLMREAENLRVPVAVDVGVGRNWLEAK